LDILIIGGTRFVGYLLAWRMLARGHRVTLFNRGTIEDPFEERVRRIQGDRTTADFSRLLRGQKFDAVIDFAAFTGADAQGAIDVFAGNVGQYIFISTGQVYLVRQNCPRPARESDYAGPLMPEVAEASPDRKDWLYGIHKRAAEDALMQAHATRGFPETRLRIPMVNGERDFYRRIENYLWRLLDGGPLLLPEVGPQLCRHVYGWEVVRAIEAVLGKREAFGRPYNICQEEQPPLAELLGMLAGILGTRLHLVPVAVDALAAHGLTVKGVSPFSDTWMSRLDPALAVRELGFVHEPLERYVEKIVASFLAHPPHDQPAGYASREVEIELARKHA
jgi:nucleoside-diphosphate-sugar epimerase